MNKAKLREAKDYFYELYPKGFEDEGLEPVRKRHNTAKLEEQVHEMFAKDNFGQPDLICENFSKIVSKSTLISLFEKPKVRDMVGAMGSEQKDIFSIGLSEMLHGNMKNGFEILVDILADYKLAKWSLVTLIPYYYAREKEIFVKPTTTKDIIKFFEIEDLKYKPTPTYEFYKAYKKIILDLKKEAKDLKIKDNAAFTGFLMIGMREEKE